MKNSTKIFIAIGIALALLVIAEMSISTFFANKYAEQHGHEETIIHVR